MIKNCNCGPIQCHFSGATPGIDRMLKIKFLACLCLAATLGRAADREQVPLGPIDDPSAVTRSIPALARDVMAVYRETDRRLFLENLFRLQLAAGDDEAAARTIDRVIDYRPCERA
jgi:hypothetical protein